MTFVFFAYDWNHTAAFASLLLGCAAVSLPLMPVFGWAMTADRPETTVRDQFHRLAWYGLAVRGDAGRHAAGTVVDVVFRTSRTSTRS